MRLLLRSALAYGLVGPPLGAAFLVVVYLASLLVGFDWVGVPEFVAYAIESVLVSYLLGGLQAIFVGLVVGLVKLRGGQSRMLVPVVAAVVAWAAFAFVGCWFMGASSEAAIRMFLSWNAVLWLSLHVAAAAGSWTLMRWWRMRVAA